MKPKGIGWDGIARDVAKDAHENNFESRCGIFGLEEDWLCIYDNHPWANDKGRRGRELDVFEELVAGRGITVLGYGEYPDSGPDKGYSCGLVLDASYKRQEEVTVLWEEAVRSQGKS